MAAKHPDKPSAPTEAIFIKHNRDNYRKCPWTSYFIVLSTSGIIFMLASSPQATFSPTEFKTLNTTEKIFGVGFAFFGLLCLIPATFFLVHVITYQVLKLCGRKCPASCTEPCKRLENKGDKDYMEDDLAEVIVVKSNDKNIERRNEKKIEAPKQYNQRESDNWPQNPSFNNYRNRSYLGSEDEMSSGSKFRTEVKVPI